jgi:hypothetical protein
MGFSCGLFLIDRSEMGDGGPDTARQGFVPNFPILYPFQMVPNTPRFSTTFVCTFDRAVLYAGHSDHHQYPHEKARRRVVFIRT